MQTHEIESLIEQLGSPDCRERGTAEEALAKSLAEGDNSEVMTLVLQGMAHPKPRVRRWCADLMDHNGTDACVPSLLRLLRDPVPKVRRQAVHSLSCQRCKQTPLCVDAVPYLVEFALSDPNRKIRLEAVYGLSLQPRDDRSIQAMKAILNQETDPRLLKAAHQVLYRLDDAYRQAVKEKARARAQARRVHEDDVHARDKNAAGHFAR